MFCWLEVDFREYNKITASVEEKVNSTPTDKKALLQPALASLINTIKRQPDIFSNLLRMSTGAPRLIKIVLLHLSMDNLTYFRIAMLKLTNLWY